MGTAYIPDDPSAYGDFGNFQPVYRRGTFITRGLGADTGIAMGRDLLRNDFTSKQATRMGIPGGASDYNHYLRAHETAHFAQQRVEGWGHFYWITAGDYEEHGMSQIYREPFTFEILMTNMLLIESVITTLP